jgi:hypothetical protein
VALFGRWDVFTEDFFPYATSEESYWVGYYTSRPEMKGLVTTSSETLRITEQMVLLSWYLNSASPPSSDLLTGMGYMRQAVSEVGMTGFACTVCVFACQFLLVFGLIELQAQHHDAITGTGVY